MLRRFTLSPLMIIAMVLFLAVGELASGTSLLYVAMMSLAMIAICITYNLLGGLGTIGGIAFTAFALYTMVISQFGKVALFQPADQTLRSPELTITVYAVYFLALMVGVFLFGWIRLSLPRPLEPTSSKHLGIMYATCFVIGLTAKVYMTNLQLEHPELKDSVGHGLARAFSLLLALSLVLAVDRRIRRTEGRHCFGWAALWPFLAIEFLGWAATSRTGFLEPPLIVFVTAYFRGYRFRARHYTAAVTIALALFLVVSPWYIWARRFRSHQTSLWARITTMGRLLASVRENWPQVESYTPAITKAAASKANEYFSNSGDMLNRLVLIEDDSGVIAACSHYHWGLETIDLDFVDSIPNFIQPNKPEADAEWYRASIGGLQSSQAKSAHITTSIIADSWGGFGWMGLIAVPLVLVPWLFVVYDSMFDIRLPWGTVATVALVLQMGEGGVGVLLFALIIQMPLYVLLISWFTGWIVRHIPLSGDAPLRQSGPLFQRENPSALAGN